MRQAYDLATTEVALSAKGTLWPMRHSDGQSGIGMATWVGLASGCWAIWCGDAGAPDARSDMSGEIALEIARLAKPEHPAFAKIQPWQLITEVKK